MYVEEGPGSTGEGGLVKEVPNPDALSGLYIKNRRGEVVKAPIPSDHIAYQVRLCSLCCGDRTTHHRACVFVPCHLALSPHLALASHHSMIILATLFRDPPQVGEAMQVHSGGALRATPHYVRAAKGPKAAGVARNTFAVFMQPDVTQVSTWGTGKEDAGEKGLEEERE